MWRTMTLMEALHARHLPLGHAAHAAMTRDPAAAPTRSGERRLKLAMLVLAFLPIGGAALLAIQAKHAAPQLAMATTDCSAWDRAASQRVAGLVGDESAAAQLRLDEALMQLRRARKFCRSGFVAVAESDYRALARALPDVAISILTKRTDPAPNSTHQ